MGAGRHPDRTGRRSIGLLAVAGLVLAVLAPALVAGPAEARPDPGPSLSRTTSSPQPVTAVAPTGGAAAAGAAATTYPPLDLGFTAFVLWRDWPHVDEVFAVAKTAGTRWMRVDMGWCSLEEYGSGVVSTWYQDRLDYVVTQARRNGIKLLMMVGCAPGWAGGTTYHDLPSRPAEYRRVMTYLSQRYAGRVAAWEIWNEPDCIGGCGRGSAAEYAPVLQAGFRGVRAGDPKALVVTGGVSGNNVPWLTELYAHGAKGFFDVMATHPYLAPTTAGPYSDYGGIYTIAATAQVHALMQKHGDGSKQIWFTEYGWSTPGRGSDRPGVSEATQASYLTKTTTLLTTRYPYVTKAFWYVLRDRDDSTQYENSFGLLHLDGTPKPAYSAFSRSVGKLAP